MTSRERVRAAFEHRQPDKVPVDFGGMCCSMINAIVLKDRGHITGWSTVRRRSMTCPP
ncbi:hypothetical protein LC724_07220 [Blautia sp. RD014234]|nr:hypothetical protein [Blautia parvula]